MKDIGLCLVLSAGRPRPCLASNLPALYLSVRGNACACVPLFFSGIRRPALLPPASFRRTLLYHPCLQLPFASVGLGMDFVRYTCHNTGHHQLAAEPSPAHIGIGGSLTAPPSHTTQHTGPYCAIRLMQGRNQIQGNERPSDLK